MVSLLGGLALFAISVILTRTPEGFITGFPLVYGSLVSICWIPNPFNGCGYSYNMGFMVLDYMIWVGTAFLLALATVRIRSTLNKAQLP